MIILKASAGYQFKKYLQKINKSSIKEKKWEGEHGQMHFKIKKE